ncbi:MAG: ParB/RepB/Spo0J family partition protein [Robiginitomaculum sp.]|nr:ParB/RepB/Spo0J family partition protein [Robiginitomaculum sp.]
MSKKPASKLGRGLSALMADIAVPESSVEKPAKKSGENKPVEPTPKQPPIRDSLNSPDKGHPPIHGNQDTIPIARALVKRGVHEIPIDKLERNPSQPRQFFDKAKLAELTNSIAQKGVLQPILVRPLPSSYGIKGKRIDNRYQIVAGERRWHAAQAAGLEAMPALIRDLSDREVLEIGVIENVQRTDLNPIEEAEAYQALIDQFGRKQIEIAGAVGKSRSHIANCLRLLKLPTLALEYLEDGKITAGHARAILSAPDPAALADAIVSGGLSVRAAEKWSKDAAKAEKYTGKTNDAPDANIHFIERKLSQHIGMDVRINHKNPAGALTIKYKTMEQFDDLVKRIRQS